ncbi:hypothetical protein [uncultured Sphingomonas sp.]|uniref:hypothetical protein n=1 Tax=uncultured Sphingomonas sp. TaxID=158754 RepID=UPI0035CB6A3B
MSRTPRLHRQLLRALARSAADEGCAVELSHAGETPWATATFTGARHRLHAAADAAPLAHWLAMLPEAELPLAGWFVASCAAEVVSGEAVIELLVLEQ